MADNLIKRIRTNVGDCPIDYESLANRPSSMKNPYPIRFTGAVSKTYDGSQGVEVNIPTGGGGGTSYVIGDGLKLDPESNTLSVDTANAVEQDNTLPVTSAAVYTTVGNIETLLGTI